MWIRALIGTVIGGILVTGAVAPGRALPANQPRPTPAKAGSTADSIEAINADFEKGFQQLERARLSRLANLAASLPVEKANAVYEDLFQNAVASGIYTDAEPIAERVLQARTFSPEVTWLATFVNLMAEAKRGAYDESLKSVVAAIQANEKARAENPEAQAAFALPETMRAQLIDAYYQILVQADQFGTAHQAMEMIQRGTNSELIRNMVTNRLRQLDLIGKPAPPIVGADLDGKPFDLAAYKGDVVLVSFFATWSMPSAQELEWFESVYDQLQNKGFRVVSIDVDAMREGGASESDVREMARRFALEYNIHWPILMNQAGTNYAAAYGVSEIPSNVLIGRDGKVAHLDLKRSNLETKVQAELAKPR
jgi:peroxiredoxin